MAAERGGAQPVIAQLPNGLNTALGKTYVDGQEPSGGQWQRLALSRGMMPEAPLCFVLDEPTAALDPAAEQALFERYRVVAAAAGDEGAITIVVSHRFSSVRMADLIAVMGAGKLIELGSHEELIAMKGRYAELYQRQADAYE